MKNLNRGRKIDKINDELSIYTLEEKPIFQIKNKMKHVNVLHQPENGQKK